MNKDKVIIFIPNEKDYIEILGHRLDFNGGWEEFLEYLKQLELKKQRIDKAIEYLEDSGIDNLMMKYCNIYDVNGIELMKILRGKDEN